MAGRDEQRTPDTKRGLWPDENTPMKKKYTYAYNMHMHMCMYM